MVTYTTSYALSIAVSYYLLLYTADEPSHSYIHIYLIYHQICYRAIIPLYSYDVLFVFFFFNFDILNVYKQREHWLLGLDLIYADDG